MAHRNWTRDETLLAFRLYCHTPFGRLHRSNPDIIELARLIDRTPSAVGMKACNFASLDPLHAERGVVGLQNRSRLEEEIWEEFMDDSEAIAGEAEEVHERFTIEPASEHRADRLDPAPTGPTEMAREVRVRRVQSFFRMTVLSGYGQRCALTGLAIPSMLNASHIIPWTESPSRRADPTNGLCLNALHDRAFDRGLITLDETLHVIVSSQLREGADLGTLAEHLSGLSGRRLRTPERFAPSPDAIAHHRTKVFMG